MTSRRQILKSGLVLGASIAGGLQARLIQAASTTAEMFSFANLDRAELVYTAYPSRQEFAELLGNEFWVDMGPGESMLRLILKELINVDEDAFILVFRTRDRRKLAQDTYRVEHATIGPVPIFMGHNPVTQRKYLERFIQDGKQKVANRYFYEAIFNFRGLPKN